MIRKICASLSIILFTGCAGSSLHKVESFQDAERFLPIKKADANDKASGTSLPIQNSESQLARAVDDAIAAGPSAISFLSSDLYIKAADASLRENHQMAALLFKYIGKLNPEDPYLGKRYAVELIRLGELGDALIVLKKLFADGLQKDETLGLILAGVYSSLKKTTEAKTIYESILVHHPESVEACIFLSKALSLQQKYQLAHEKLSKCQKNAENKAVFAYYKGKIEVTRKKYDKAAEYFKRALEIDPLYHQAATALGLYYEQKEQQKKAIQLYKHFLESDPESFSILTRLVNLLFMMEEFNDVVPYAERLSSLDPSDLNLKIRLGILYTESKSFAKAKSIFKEILTAFPSSDKVLYYLGSLYQQTEELQESIEYFSQVSNTSPLFHDASVQIAQILNTLALENSLHEKKFFDYVQDIAKTNDLLKVELQVILAGYFEAKLFFDKAILALENAKNGNQKFSEGHNYYLAALYEKNNQFVEAQSIIHTILAENPENPHALNFLGYSLVERGEDFEKAFQYISKAVTLKPDDGYIRDSLGWYYFKTGKIQKAYSETKKAWSLVKTDPVISKHLAIIYKEMKKYELAKKFYVEALKLCKQESDKQEVLRALEDLESLRLPASRE